MPTRDEMVAALRAATLSGGDQGTRYGQLPFSENVDDQREASFPWVTTLTGASPPMWEEIFKHPMTPYAKLFPYPPDPGPTPLALDAGYNDIPHGFDPSRWAGAAQK